MAMFYYQNVGKKKCFKGIKENSQMDEQSFVSQQK